MHPTPDEQLRAAHRLIEQVTADPALSAESKELLDDASRLLRRLERSWPHRLPFLAADNRLAADLLTALTPLLPDLAPDIEAATAELPVDDEPPPTTPTSDSKTSSAEPSTPSPTAPTATPPAIASPSIYAPASPPTPPSTAPPPTAGRRPGPAARGGNRSMVIGYARVRLLAGRSSATGAVFAGDCGRW